MGMYLGVHFGVALALVLALSAMTGCSRQPQEAGLSVSDHVASARSRWRGEPVIYNGRRYEVSFREAGGNVRLVRVRAPGRRLGATPGDGRIIAEIATSAVHHFTCRDGQRAQVRPGSMKPRNGYWMMQIECR